MASDYNVKQHDVREVEYNVYEDPIFGSTFTQLSVSDIKAGTGKIHTYDGEDAEFIYDILVGNFDAGKRISELNKVISDKNDTIKNLEFVIKGLEKDVQLSRKKYADLERDYQYYVKDKTDIFNKREKYINELEDTIYEERKKYAEATKLNDDLHKDLTQWKQMYEEVYACYNHEVDISKENEELMKVNRELRIERDKYKKELEKPFRYSDDFINTLKKDLAEEKLIRTALEKQIGELKLENECQKVTIKKHEKHIGAYATEVRDLRHELKRVNSVIECQEIAHNYRYLKSENEKLRADLTGAFEDVKKLSDERCCLIKRQDELTFENSALRDNAKYWREQYEELEKKRASWRECQKLKNELDEETAARKALNERCQELEKEYVACMDTIKAQQRAVSDLNGELKIVRDANESLKKMQAESIKKIKELETKLTNAQESNGKIWSMYAEQYAKNVVGRVPDFGLKKENRRLTTEIESLNRAHRDLMDDVANSNRVIERLKKEIKDLEARPTYTQISGMRTGTLVLKLVGENRKLKKDLEKTKEELEQAVLTLSDKGCELIETKRKLEAIEACHRALGPMNNACLVCRYRP